MPSMQKIPINLDLANKHFTLKNGKLFWRARRGSRSAGAEAGTLSDTGYLMTKLNGKRVRVHRVIYAMHHGIDLRDQEIDHINSCRTDNRPENLRSVSHMENQQNQKKPSHNTSGYVGVGWRSSLQKWRAHIQVAGKSIHLGYFDSRDNAIKARKEALKQHGFHPNHAQK
jgi:hypothetical protein